MYTLRAQEACSCSSCARLSSRYAKYYAKLAAASKAVLTDISSTGLMLDVSVAGEVSHPGATWLESARLAVQVVKQGESANSYAVCVCIYTYMCTYRRVYVSTCVYRYIHVCMMHMCMCIYVIIY